MAAIAEDYFVTVCDKCLCASCWHGDFLCQESQSAGTCETLASTLIKLGNENPEHFSREKIRQVTGSDPKPIPAFGCVNNTIRLRSGKYLDLANPKPDQMTFADIAGALSKICRFGGQCDRFYSVAEHCYHCAMQAKNDGRDLEDQKACLLHDAAEAFIGDVVKPLKIMLPDYSEVEMLMEDCIANKFDIQSPIHIVREIDHAMLIAERRRMFSRDEVIWSGEETVRSLSIEFKCWSPSEAEQMFVLRATAIGINVQV